MKRLTLSLLVCSLVIPASAEIRIISVEPTTLFPRATPLRQIAVVTVLNDAVSTASAKASTRLAGGQWASSKPLELSPGVSRHRVLVADIKEAAELHLTLDVAGQNSSLTWHGSWQPQRKWKVFIMESSHEDLGYEDYIFNKQKEVADFIDLAKHLSGNAENQSEFERAAANRYQFTMETLVSYRNFLEERGPVAWRKLARDYLAKGNMHMGGAPSGVHNHWMDYEELARNMYPGRLEMKHRYGLDLKTYMIVDNPSASWAAAQAAAQAGFKYIARWGQGWRTGGNNDYRTTRLPALFWWQGPNGKDRVLYGWRTHYGQGFWFGQSGAGSRSMLGDLPADFVSSYLLKVESGQVLGPYPYDAIIEPSYGDHDVPFFDRGLLARWSAQYAFPEIRVSGPDPFFAYIESGYGNQLPVLSGDLNNFSADYSTIDPESQGWKRTAARMLPLAETLGVLAGIKKPSGTLSPARIDRTYTRLFDYDEHSWPTLLPASDVQLFNASWIKKQEAQRALAESTQLLQMASSQLAAQIASPSGASIAVFNGLGHARTGLVEWEGKAASLIDVATGRQIPVQQRNGKSIFVAHDIPALGYRVYRIASIPAKLSAAFVSTPIGVENEFYQLSFDSKTGSLNSIKDKTSGRELLDPKSKFQANQMVYVSTASREALPTSTYSPVSAKSMGAVWGPVAAEFKVQIDDEKTGAAIQQTVTLYSGLKRIDLVNELSHVKSLYTDRFEDRYRENLFYAFPFEVDGGQIRAEAPGGVVRPHTDQLRWGSHDYLMANRWIDVSNTSHGITLAPWNAFAFHLGDIRYNRFSIDYKPSSSHLFSYAWSNRMAGLLTLSPEDCNASLGYSITSHEGDWDSGATTRFGWEIATPLIAVAIPRNALATWKQPTQSFLSISQPNVQLTVLKSSEIPGKGSVLRLVETEGKATVATLDLSALPYLRAFRTNLVEQDIEELPIQNRQLRISIEPFSLLTLRLISAPIALKPIQLSATTLSDASIRLSWTPSNARRYDIYRSTDPEDPPSAQTWIASTPSNFYTDIGLNYQANYHYHVLPVGENHLGGIAARTSQKTAAQNLTPPNPVLEPGVVRRSRNRLFVYWRKNQEPDLARYLVFRSSSPNVDTLTSKPVAVLSPSGKFLELFMDEGLKPATTYYYKILVEDHVGHRQTRSTIVSATTPK